MTNKITEKLRSFGLTNFAIDNGTSIMMLIIMILIFGLRSYSSMPKEAYPEASFPTIFINTPYFGNSASDIENLIARPIEDELSTISGVKDIKSTSIQDFSVIFVEFDADADKDIALRKVKDAVDKAKSELPTDLDQDPSVEEIVFSEFPIMTINISGNYGMDELRELAESVQDKLETMSAINKVDLKGAQDREVKVDIDLLKMQSLKVSFRDVENAISQENLSMSAGEIIRDNFRRSIRVIGEFQSMDEIETLMLKKKRIFHPIFL